jgi:UDP-N-acetylglucosamine--N-acetylmuramyl-(pentapeptide) pyrophosphoryl-undecaprenol N-acetylglucosamine transferase
MGKNILLVGGGTGGHILPLKKLVESLLSQKVMVHLLISDSDLDRRIISENFDELIQPNFQIHYRRAYKLHYYFSWENFVNIFHILKSFWSARKFLNTIKPDTIFFKGGFVGFPIILVAKFLSRFKGKIFLHESDILPGTLTKFFSRWADRVFSNFGKNALPLFYFPEKFPVVTKKDSGELLKVLIFGGSQGAQFLNELIVSQGEELFGNFQVTLVTGSGKSVVLEDPHFTQFELLPQEALMQGIFSADLVIARSGASIFQILAAKKKSIMIPLPTAARNHQWENAQYFSKQGLCRVLPQSEAHQTDLVKLIKEVLEDKLLEKTLQKNSVRNEADTIAKILVRN